MDRANFPLELFCFGSVAMAAERIVDKCFDMGNVVVTPDQSYLYHRRGSFHGIVPTS